MVPYGTFQLASSVVQSCQCICEVRESRREETRGDERKRCDDVVASVPLLILYTLNRSGCILNLHSLATRPPSWTTVLTPSRTRMCVNPISCSNSSVRFSWEGGGDEP